MRLKHFAGYGTVEAKKLNKSERDGIVSLTIRVKGNHEWGLVRKDKYDVAWWLIKRFDRKFEDYRQIKSLDILMGFEDGIEVADYLITYTRDPCYWKF